MAAFSTALLAVAGLVGTASANVPGTYSMPIGRTAPRQALYKRDPQAVSLGNNVTYGLYYVNASIGTPGQTVQLQLDTGSSDVWIFDPAACAEAQCAGGSFNPSKSSSFKNDTSLGEFQIQYVTPGSGVNGTYFYDTLQMGSLKLTNLIMALAYQAAAVTSGIMGVGFDTDESLAANEGSVYPSIIDTMVNESVISSHSYSLWLDDLEASTGTILFGGYDSGKYQAPITVLDLQDDAQSGDITSFTVAWSLLALTDPTGTYSISAPGFPYAAVLDSGTTLMAVPDEIYEAVGVYFGAVNTEEYGAIIPCSHADWPGTLDFQFAGSNGPIIRVPFSELAIPTTDENGNPLVFKNKQPACLFGVQPSPEEGIYLLGDTFLRSAYVVYDMDAKQVAIAQTIYNSTKSNVQSIGSGTALQSIISSASYATGAAATQTATGIQLPGFGGTTRTGEVGSSTIVGSGSLSHVAGVKTTLSLASLSNTPTANVPTGTGSNAGSNTGTATSTKNAAAGIRPTGSDNGAIFSIATFFAMMAAGALMFVSF